MLFPTRRAALSLVALASATAGLLTAGALPAPAQAPEPPTVIVLFDGSGSMWGNPEGDRRNKLTLARDGVRSGLARLAATTRAGLMSFGHRRSGDCGDVELIVNPEAGTGPGINGALEKLSPRGRGPITQALREAAKHLPPAPAAASIVLVHDDLDNCQLDPCTAVGDLRRANPRVVVHVVSIMRRDDAQKMLCLPRATGGKHWDVQGATQITAAVDEAMRLAGAAAPEPARAPSAATASTQAPQPAPSAPPAQPERGLTLRAVLVEGAPPVDAGVRWRVTRRGETTPAWEGEGAVPRLDLPPGRYDVEAWLGFVRARQSFDVAEGAAQQLDIALGAGLLQMPQVPGGERDTALARTLADTVVMLKRIDPNAETVAFQRGLVGDLALVPGNYVVSLTSGSVRLERTVGVRAGQVTAFDPGLGLGLVELATATTTVDAGGTGALVTLFEDDPDAPQGRREVWRSAATPAIALLPAGTYYAVVRRGSAEARERLVVKAGAVERRTIALDVARLTVAVRPVGGRIEPGEPVSHRLERVEGDREPYISTDAQAIFHVPAGRWRLESRIGLANAVVQRDIELKAGAREQLMLDLPAGVVRLKWLEQAGGNPLPDVLWEVRDGSGRLVWSATQTEARPLLLAGRYSVRGEARERRIERTIDVRAGESRVVEIVGQ